MGARATHPEYGELPEHEKEIALGNGCKMANLDSFSKIAAQNENINNAEARLTMQSKTSLLRKFFDSSYLLMSWILLIASLLSISNCGAGSVLHFQAERLIVGDIRFKTPMMIAEEIGILSNSRAITPQTDAEDMAFTGAL